MDEKQYEKVDGGFVIEARDKTNEPVIEVCRSFAYKHSVPGAYESRDFFMSAKAQAPLSEAEDLSERLHLFCRSEVLKSVANHIREAREQASRKKGIA